MREFFLLLLKISKENNCQSDVIFSFGVEQVDIETVSVIFIVYMSSMMCSTCVHIISIFFLHRCAHVAENVGMLWHNLHKGTQRTTENKCQGILIHFICRFFPLLFSYISFFVLCYFRWNEILRCNGRDVRKGGRKWLNLVLENPNKNTSKQVW